MKFPISLLASVFDLEPRNEELSWQDFTELFAEPRQSPCTLQTCLRGNCSHKRGACWSAFAIGSRERESSLLAFDIDRLTDDRGQLDEIRGRLGRLQYLMHSTHSDRPDSRCLRVIIALSSPVAADKWGPFFHACRRSLVPEADLVCADGRRLHFLPSCPRDGSYFIQVNKGSPLDVDVTLSTISSSQGLVEEVTGNQQGETMLKCDEM